jgi:predicted phosphodiesterase
MLIAVLSDIHGNLVALKAVLEAAAGVDAIWCLGDTVGYGPQPEACLSLMMERAALCVAGNHDRAAIRQINVEDFNSDARRAAQWTETQLSDESRAFLDGLPERLVEGDFTLVHGSPRNPIWEYLISARSAERSFEHFDTTCCLVGHTHLPSIFILVDGRVRANYAPADSEIVFEPGTRYILNPGSVGQPRDENPLAAYLILDTEARRATWRRVEYDIAETQEEMRRQNLPPRLVDRLAKGR